MTETMVERVAHAMAQRSDARVAGMYTINSLPMSGRENFLELAKAAIEAMRTPTEEMRYAINRWVNEPPQSEAAQRAWGRFIEAALKE